MVALSADEHISSFSTDGLYTVASLMGGNPLILKRLYNLCPEIQMKVQVFTSGKDGDCTNFETDASRQLSSLVGSTT